jgi:ABC-2 type transport system permease protein
MKEIRFALYAIKKNIVSSTELRTSFAMNVFGMAINNSSFMLLWIFFVKSVGVINGWRSIDIIALLGFNTLCFGIVFSFFAGIRKVPEYVTSGAFDRFMLAPKSLIVRIATSSFNASAVGDMFFGVVCLAIYGVLAHVTLYQIILMCILVVISCFIYVGYSLVINSLSFYFTDATQLVNGVFELFLTPSMFHGGAFSGVMRFIFIFLIPALVVGTLPVEIVRDISLDKLGIALVVSIVWMILSIWVSNKSVRKYESANLMTFGS